MNVLNDATMQCVQPQCRHKPDCRHQRTLVAFLWSLSPFGSVMHVRFIDRFTDCFSGRRRGSHSRRRIARKEQNK